MASQIAGRVEVRRHRLVVATLGFLMALGGMAQSAAPREAEIGSDFQISTMGGSDPNGYSEAGYPALAYNSTDGNYLVVWHGEEEVGSLADDEWEIYGKVVAPGSTIPAHFRVSDAGPDGDYEYEARDPNVAYNSMDNEFMVVWYAPDDADLYDVDVYASRYTPASSTVGADIEVSYTPDAPAPNHEKDTAEYPDIAYNPKANEYFVVFAATIVDTSTGNYQWEIFGRRVSNTATLLGSQIRISTMGPEPPNADFWKYSAQYPAVAYNTVCDCYLVAWVGDTDTGLLVDDEMEIWAQRVDATTGSLLGGNVRVSTAGTDGDASDQIYVDAYWPDVAANPDRGEFLVVWQDDRDVDSDPDIFGQRVNSGTGSLLGSDFQISQTPPPGSSPQYMAMSPAPVYNPVDREYLVVWHGIESKLGEGRLEIWGQRLDEYGNEIGTDDLRISNMTLDGDPEPWSRAGNNAGVAFDSQRGEYLVVWDGRFPPQQYYDDTEIFGQRLMPDKIEFIKLNSPDR